MSQESLFTILMVKRIMSRLLIIFFTASTISIHAQLDWNSYNDPGGTFYRLIVQPELSYQNTDGAIVIINGLDSRLNLPVTFRAEVVKEKQILSVFSSQAFYYNYDNDDNPSIITTDYYFSQNLQARYFHYFSERRGFHVQPQIILNYRVNDPNYVDRNSIGVFFGKGRMENISTLYQSLRIQKQYNASALDPYNLNQTQLFSLADEIRRLDFNPRLDSRYRDIENQETYLERMEQLGFNLDNYYNIANTLDAYRFERSAPQSTQGTLLQAGFQRSWFGNNAVDELVLFMQLGRAINENWHSTNSLRFQYDVNGEYEIFFQSHFQFIPIARTQISFLVTPIYNSVQDGRFDFFSFTDMRYFINPQLSLNGHLSIRYYNVNTDFDGRAIEFSFGVNYFII